MARARVNLIVGVGSAATLAASVAGIAQADGYFASETADIVEPVAAVSSSMVLEVEPEGGDSRAAAVEAAPPTAQLQVHALPSLGALPVSPGRSVVVPALPAIQIESDEGFELDSGRRGSVDVGSSVPTSAPAPAAPRVVTVQVLHRPPSLPRRPHRHRHRQWHRLRPRHRRWRLPHRRRGAPPPPAATTKAS